MKLVKLSEGNYIYNDTKASTVYTLEKGNFGVYGEGTALKLRVYKDNIGMLLACFMMSDDGHKSYRHTSGKRLWTESEALNEAERLIERTLKNNVASNYNNHSKMKIYSPDGDKVTHIVRYTIQSGEYKGYFTIEVGGNCKGASLMNTDIAYDIDPENDIVDCNCELAYYESNNSFDCALYNEDGEISYLEGLSEQELSDMIVAIEIVDYKTGF